MFLLVALSHLKNNGKHFSRQFYNFPFLGRPQTSCVYKIKLEQNGDEIVIITDTKKLSNSY